MTSSIGTRQVMREVVLVTCNRCQVEVLEENAAGWMHCCELVVSRGRAGQADNSERHLCPPCKAIVIDALNAGKPAAAAPLVEEVLRSVKPVQVTVRPMTPGEQYLADRSGA